MNKNPVDYHYRLKERIISEGLDRIDHILVSKKIYEYLVTTIKGSPCLPNDKIAIKGVPIIFKKKGPGDLMQIRWKKENYDGIL